MIHIRLETPPSLYTKTSEFLQIQHHNSGQILDQKCFQHKKRFLDCYEMIYVSKGRLYLQQEDEQFVLNENDYLFLSPYQTSFGYDVFREEVSFHWVSFSTTDFAHFGINQQYAQCADPHSLLTLLDKITKTLYTDKSLMDIYIAVLLSEIGFMQKRNILPSVLENGLDWIKNHATAQTTAKEIGETLGYNQDYLTRLFKQHLKMGLKRYIDITIINRAKTLMRTSQYSIKEISKILDFETPNHLNKFFKYHTKTSPSAYRKNCNN